VGFFMSGAHYIGDSISIGCEKQTVWYRPLQSALQTVLQNRYSLHYKMCYRNGTVCITKSAKERVQSAFQTVLQDS